MKDNIIRKTTGMKAETVEDLSANYFIADIQLRREEGKTIISKGGPWVSIAFKIRDDLGKGAGFLKVMLASFKNFNGAYKRFSYFNIKTKMEAKTICNVLIDTFGLEIKDGRII